MPIERQSVRPRFTIKDLLISTAIVAAGLIAIYGVRIDYESLDGWRQYFSLLPWPIGCAMVGAGVFYPFNKTVLGIKIGIAMGVVLPILFIIYIVWF